MHEKSPLTAKEEFPWPGEQPYNSTAAQYKARFGGRVQKVSLHADFTCPNRDGKLGRGGCTFCNNDSFTPSYVRESKRLYDQIDKGVSFLERRYKRTAMFVGYFQAYTNTYGDLKDLKKLYDHVLAHPKIEGLVIGTRPDCVNEEMLDYFAALGEKHYIHLEYGVESCYDRTLEAINRGHDFATSVKAIEMTAERGLHVGAHMVFGLPGDSRKEMLDQVHLINKLPINAIKFHQLQIVQRTVMAKQYKETPEMFDLFDREEYIEFVCDFVERMRPDISIDRFGSEAPPSIKIAPKWNGARVDALQKAIGQELVDRESFQGQLYTPE